MMGWRGRAGFVVGVGVCWGLVQAQAHACSCFGSSRLVAPAGAMHPVDAPLVFETTCYGDLVGWSALVDGEAAELVGGAPDGIGDVAIEPAPTEGAEVVVMYECGAASDDEGCSAAGDVIERARFLVGPRDTVAPAPADDVAVEHEAGMFAGECGAAEDSALLVRSVATFADVEAGTWAVVRFVVDGDVVHSEERRIPSPEVRSEFFAEASTSADREVCVEVEVRDASGNASAVQNDCSIVPAAPSSSGCSFAPNARDPWLLCVAAAFVRRRRR